MTEDRNRERGPFERTGEAMGATAGRQYGSNRGTLDETGGL